MAISPPPALSHRLGPVGRAEGRLRLLHAQEIAEQPAAVADTLLGHFVDGRIVLDEQRLSDRELREVDKVFIVACGTAYHPAAGQNTPSSTGPGCPSRWSSPANSVTATRFWTAAPWWSPSVSPVRPPTRSKPSAMPRARRPRCWRSATNGSQIPRAGRCGSLHPRRPGDRGSRHQDVPRADRRELPRRTRAGAGPRHQVPRRGGARYRELEAMPGLVADVLATMGPVNLAERFARSNAVLFLGRRRISGRPRRRAQAQGTGVHARRGFAAGELKHGPIALIGTGCRCSS